MPAGKVRAARIRRLSISIHRAFASNSLETLDQIAQLDVQPARQSEEPGERRIRPATLQVAHVRKFDSHSLGQLLLSQPGLMPQIFHCASQGGVIGRSRFGLTTRGHCLAQPVGQTRWTLDNLSPNAAAREAPSVPVCGREALDNKLSNVLGRRALATTRLRVVCHIRTGAVGVPWSAHPGSLFPSQEGEPG